MLASIKARIIFYYLAVLFVVLSLLATFLYFSLDKIVYKALDAGLLEKAKAIASLIDVDSSESNFNLSDEIMWEYRSPSSGSFFQVRRPDGTTMAKSASLGRMELPPARNDSGPFITTIRLGGRIVRLVDFKYGPRSDTDEMPLQGWVVQCGEDIGTQLELLHNFRTVLFGAVLSVMFISALGGFILAKKALAPVLDISQVIDKISEQDLTKRVSLEGVPHELKILAVSFNRTFNRLEEAFNRQKRFAADASHELRTPLSVILTESEIALRKERPAGEYRASLDAVLDAAKRMSSTVQKLLALTRLSSDKIELKFESINVRALIGDVVRLLSPIAEEKGIIIEAARIPASLTVRGDRERLLELFTNLLDNAVKYNIPRGRVDISAREEAEFVLCEIMDTGIGIPGFALDKVFDRFYRVDRSRCKEVDGTGLGLSICREIARLHEGKIDIKSKEREGTILSVYLKRIDAPLKPAI